MVSEAIEKLKNIFEKDLIRQVVKIRLEVIEEHRQPFFRDFEDTIRYADTKDHYCAVCLHHRFCVMGHGQYMACAASFTFQNADEDTQQFYINYPLTEQSIARLDRKGLLGVFYFQKYNIRTLSDYSLRNLRARLVEIMRENSPYRLTT